MRKKQITNTMKLCEGAAAAAAAAASKARTLGTTHREKRTRAGLVVSDG